MSLDALCGHRIQSSLEIYQIKALIESSRQRGFGRSPPETVTWLPRMECRNIRSVMPTDSSPLQQHIDVILKHEAEFLARRTAAERVGDFFGAFVGSLIFIGIHAVWFGTWILINTLGVGGIPRFDPVPFPLLDTLVAIEAIFLASFIVMRQSRLSRRSDERDHLILQVLLLAEKEITAVLQIERQVAAQAGLSAVAEDADITQLSQKTSIDDVAQSLKESMPSE
jgi:uncharacterized membrane protein